MNSRALIALSLCLFFMQSFASAEDALLDEKLALDCGNGVKLELLLIKPGTFEMGSPADEAERGKDESLHSVTLSKAFYMGKYPVTQEQFLALTGKNPSVFNTAKLNADTAQHPVDSVTWEEAAAFCKALNEKIRAQLPQGMEVRLPTEAQWEYACRAGTKAKYYSGNADADLDAVAWHKANSGGKSHPVGGKKPNAFGLYDMLGNVWQWCRDGYAEHYETLAAVDPVCAQDGGRILHGGSWRSTRKGSRAAYRNNDAIDFRGENYGFRVSVSRN